MFNKLKQFWQLIQRGQELSRPEVWGNRTALVSAITGLLTACVALAKSFGLEVEAGPVQAEAAAYGLVSLYSFIMAWVTAATRKDVGIPNKDNNEH